ncbi:hypothetical protein LL240_06815 [Oceanimonas baumannii]|uniref:hypothetical protein n=1 Tax=Oceanimonas baumannii TaxID=129578 RepID=UPI001D187821|nr:hypothetical protein [Oceanimonas baumannii]MCC4264163.1 hypothetical protein [Oceanimonas baumannii]
MQVLKSAKAEWSEICQAPIFEVFILDAVTPAFLVTHLGKATVLEILVLDGITVAFAVFGDSQTLMFEIGVFNRITVGRASPAGKR